MTTLLGKALNGPDTGKGIIGNEVKSENGNVLIDYAYSTSQRGGTKTRRAWVEGRKARQMDIGFPNGFGKYTPPHLK